MDLHSIKSILEIGFSSNMPILLFGTPEIGKTAFCKQTFPNSKVILNSDIDFSGLSILNSIAKTTKVIIFENPSEETINKIKPVILKKTIFGDEINNFFIITAHKDLKELNGFIKVEFTKPTVQEWLHWAENSNIHSFIKKLVQEHGLYEKLKPKELENISKILNTGISSELLDAIVGPLLGNNKELLSILKEEYDDSIEFQKVILLENKEFINKLKHTSSKNIEKFNEELLQELKFDESIITKEKIISYLSSIDASKSLKLLWGLLENKDSFDYLNEILADEQIRKKIDSLL